MSTPSPLRRDTRVFISAVTRELGTVRKLVKKALEDNDYHAVEQDNFPPDYRDLVDKLRERIASCDAVIHIAGHCHGAEPPNRPEGAPRRSYTQLEYDIAKALGKPVYVFVTGDGFPTDSADPEPAELRELQDAHRQRLMSSGADYNPTDSTDDLDQRIRNLQLKVERLGGELHQVDVKVNRLRPWIVTAAVVGVVALGTIAYFGWRQQVEQRAQQVERERQERERIAAETARREAQETKQAQMETAEGLLNELLTDKTITVEEARRRALTRLSVVKKLSQAEIESLINRKIPAGAPAPTPVDEARAALAKGDYAGVSRIADKQKQQSREIAMLEGTAALAQFRQTPKPEWNDRALAAFRRAMTLSDPKSTTEWKAWTDAAVSAASVLYDIVRHAEAEPLLRDSLRLREAHSEPNDPGVAQVLNNLALLLQATNRLAEAEPLHRRALAISERSLGPDHPDVATRLNNLAELLRATNRAAEAEPIYRRAVAIGERSLGPDHPDVAVHLNNLALLLKATNRAAEAEPLCRRALAIGERSLGPDHPEVATRLNNLAALLRVTNRPAEAEPLYRRALTIDERSHGPDHPNVSVCLNNLALVLHATNRPAETEPLMARAIGILARFRRSTGHEHPNMRAQITNYRLLLALRKLAKPDEIEARIKAATQETDKLSPIGPEVERLLGPARPVADVLAALDRSYKEQGKAAVYFLKAKEPIVPHLDEFLRPSADGLGTRGLSAFRAGAPADAIVLYDAALDLMAGQPAQDPAKVRTRLNRAAALRETGLVEPAREELIKLLPDLDRLPAAEALMRGGARYHLALCQWRLGERGAAQRSAQESLAAYGAAPKDKPIDPVLRRQTERLLADLKAGKAPPPLPPIDAPAAIEAARARYKAREAMAKLPLDQPSAPLLDQMLGPAKSTKDVLEALDKQSRAQGKPPVWFLPLDQPIAPHLDELLGKPAK